MKMNDKGVTKLVAGIIIAIVLIGAFLIPLALILIDTRPDQGTGFTPFGSGPGSEDTRSGTLSMRFRLDEDVTVSWVRTRHKLSLVPGVEDTQYTIQGRITSDSPSTNAPGILNFDQKTFQFPAGTTFEYNADNQNTQTTLTPGWYKYVETFSSLGPVTINTVTWNFGDGDDSEAGEVFPDFIFWDQDKNGIWEQKALGGSVVSFFIMLVGDIVTEPVVPPTEEVEEEIDLIDTIAPPPPPDVTSATTAIVIGLIILILGIFFIGLGIRGGTVILSIIGFILIIVGLAIVAFAAFIFFAPALVTRKENVSNMLKGSLNLGKRR